MVAILEAFFFFKSQNSVWEHHILISQLTDFACFCFLHASQEATEPWLPASGAGLWTWTHGLGGQWASGESSCCSVESVVCACLFLVEGWGPWDTEKCRASRSHLSSPDSRLIKAITLAKTHSGYEMLLPTALLVERNEHDLCNLLRNL